MNNLKEVVVSYQQLSQEWNKKPPQLDRCGELLDKLKVGLTKLTFLPTSNSVATKQELLVARDILEIGAQWSIAIKDIPSFERYMAQLKCYYLDYKDDLPESAYKYQLLGLNLLCLLSQNRVAEFHTELELLPPKEIQTSIYIRHPVSMEQYLMEGSYNKIFLGKGSVPAASYNFFIDILLDTIRDEIAGCIEKAYEKLAVIEAARMLFFQNPKAVKDYAVKRGWNMGKNNYIYYHLETKKCDDTIPSFELATQAIEYARELEMIIFLGKGSVPAASYNFFIDILLDTIRDEIAGCIEKAYEKLAVIEAARMLFFQNPKAVKDYAVKRGWNMGKNKYIYYHLETKKSDDTILSFESRLKRSNTAEN
uniref:26S proteasome non-ATPase regulatory subunit 8 n=1 Tax=Strigamia maritima TaxID=126957 RepID=T1JGC0_STRMM